VKNLNIKNEKIQDLLVKEVKRRFKKSVIQTIASIKLTVRSYEGISLLKSILTKGV
jgi:hypothetical protein